MSSSPTKSVLDLCQFVGAYRLYLEARVSEAIPYDQPQSSQTISQRKL